LSKPGAAKENARRSAVVDERLKKRLVEWKANCALRLAVNDKAEAFRVSTEARDALRAAFFSLEAPAGTLNRRGPPLHGSASKSSHHTRMAECPLLSWLTSFLYEPGSDQLRAFTTLNRIFMRVGQRTSDPTIRRSLLRNTVEDVKALELLYPATMTTHQLHGVVELARQAERWGPFCNRWMYPFERHNGFVGELGARNRSAPAETMAAGLRQGIFERVYGPQQSGA
jgi:hypothetical protein